MAKETGSLGPQILSIRRCIAVGEMCVIRQEMVVTRLLMAGQDTELADELLDRLHVTLAAWHKKYAALGN